MRVRRTAGYYVWLIHFFAANLAALVLLATGHYAWSLVVFLSPAPWYARQILHPATRGLGAAVTRFRTDQKEVWLTIDDGPTPATTPLMLELLAKHQARATFFLVGKNARRHPELVSEILRHGHTIGNHTETHPHNTFWYAGKNRTGREIDDCNTALHACGVATKYFRPPVGLKNHSLHSALLQRGLDLVLWSNRGFDTICGDVSTTLSRIFDRLAPGAIILVHELPAKPNQQQELICSLLDRLGRENYRCVIPSDESLIR